MIEAPDRPATTCEAFGGQCEQPATHLATRRGFPPLAVCNTHADYAEKLGWEVKATK